MEGFICPWCGHRETESGEAMMEHVLLHPEADDRLLCGTCWLPAEEGHRCHVALQRHIQGWRRDHTPNIRDWYPDADGYQAVLSNWAEVTARLWGEAEELACR